MNDIEAIEKCQAGENELFSFLVQKYQKEAFGHAIAILSNSDDALDAVQDAFLDAYKTLKKFDISRRFYPWLYTILRNRCYKILTSRKRQSTIELDEPKILAPLENDTSKAKSWHVEETLLGLSPEDREILTLKHLDGLSYDELSRMLDIPRGTVMSRLYYARIRFREKLNKILEKDDFKDKRK